MSRTHGSPGDTRAGEILRAAASWAREAPPALTPAITAVTVRLGEMIADQRHYRAEPVGLPGVLDGVAESLRGASLAGAVRAELEALSQMELRSTGAWSAVPSPQSEWSAVAIDYLAARAAELPAAERPDPDWADDLVAGITASIRAILGVDELQARTEAQYQGWKRGEGPVEEPARGG
jgi:hypothetical protein